jgi:CRISPR/Cas system-associated endonuclease Cas1
LRNHINPPTPILLRLKQAAKDANAATGIKQLLGIEGAAAATYFKDFQGTAGDPFFGALGVVG